MRRAKAAALLAVLGLAAGGCAADRPARDLLSALSEADLRANRLTLVDLAADPYFERRGWSPLEHTPDGPLAWTLGRSARLRLPFHTAEDKELRLVVRAHESLGELPLTLELNGVRVGEALLGRLARELRLPLPAAAQVAGDNSLELSVARYREPLPSDADRRPLGIAVTALEVGPLGRAGPRGVPALDAGHLVLTPGSSASWYVRLEPGARLRLTSRAGAGGEGRLVVRLETDQGGERVVRPPGAAGESERLELPATPGMLARLEVANPGDGLVFVEELRLERDPIRETAPGALAKRPGVLIYLVDTLRADRLGIYGHSAPTSPRLDALAAEALVFEDAWGQASWTRPATASILTGLHPSRHGADREDTALAPEQLTLAERLGAAGYRTGAFVANHLVGGRFGFDQGFDTWNGGDRGLYGAPARQLGERALQWLDAGQGPFLLYVHTMEPHSPYDPPAEAMAPFELPDYEGDRDTRALLRLGQLGELSPEGLRFLEARYAGEIRANDDAFGQLLDGLASRGLLDSTVVVFISDHGEELLDHGGTEHAKTLYQELVRIPLLIRLPGGERRSGRIAEPVQQIDLLPSLLALAGLEVPPDLPGRDLSASWLGDASSTRPAPLLFAEERFTVTDKLAVRNGPLKLILNNDGPELWRAGTHVELYDLAADPDERHNLAATRPIAEAFLRQELERFRRQQAARSSDATPLELTPEELEQLRALGYVQ